MNNQTVPHLPGKGLVIIQAEFEAVFWEAQGEFPRGHPGPFSLG